MGNKIKKDRKDKKISSLERRGLTKKDLEEVKKYGRIKLPFLGVKYVLLTKESAKRNKQNTSFGILGDRP